MGKQGGSGQGGSGQGGGFRTGADQGILGPDIMISILSREQCDLLLLAMNSQSVHSRRSSASPRGRNGEARTTTAVKKHMDRSPSTTVPSTSNQDTLQDVRSAIVAWIPRRKATIAKMERIAGEIKLAGEKLNKFKLASSCVGVISNATAGILGFGTIFARGAFPVPLAFLGGLAGMAGASGAFVSYGVDIIKAELLSKLLVQELQDDTYTEIDEYKSVINALARLHKAITEKNRLDYQPKSLSCSVGQVTFKVALSFLTTYSFMKVYIAEIASTVAAQVACGSSSSECIQAARNAAEGCSVGAIVKGFSSDTVKAITEAAGEGAKNAKNILVPAKEAAATAAREAARTGTRELNLPDFNLGLLAIIGNTLPFLNLGAAAMDAYEGFKAGWDIISGMYEEKLLRKKIEELKSEANKIVVNIYNPISSQETLKFPPIDTPFPEFQQW